MTSRWPDFHHTGPGTLAGRYLRGFWHPIFHSADLKTGKAKPIRIMNVDYTLYRGEDGHAYLLDARCKHRGMQLSPGWVEGNAIRCFYHGWKFDNSGQCIEQPAEPKPFAQRIRIGAYPCEEYFGLVFAYLGEGAPPPLPRYPHFEKIEGILEWDSYLRRCNYFNNMENAADLTHSGFVHRNNPGSFDGFTNSPMMDAEESCWGVTVYARWPDQVRVSQLGMPNVFHHKAQPTDFAIAPYREFLAWWVPIDDESHIQFTVAAVRLPPDKVAQYVERREQRLAKRKFSNVELGERVLKGELDLADIDRDSTDFLRLQDDIAQAGQGRIADHANESLGQSDRAVVALRRVWARELRAFGEGAPLKSWRYDRDALEISRGELWEEQLRERLTQPLEEQKT
ncbi:MAG: Rieske 2Fe-2S domain-containing protein [Burkholderiales bacterium]